MLTITKSKYAIGIRCSEQLRRTLQEQPSGPAWLKQNVAYINPYEEDGNYDDDFDQFVSLIDDTDYVGSIKDCAALRDWYKILLTKHQLPFCFIDTLNQQSAIKQTQQAIADPNIKVIVEGAFEVLGGKYRLFSRVDLLIRDGAGWILNEARAFTNPDDKVVSRRQKGTVIVEPSPLDDLAFQSYVSGHSITILKPQLIHLSKSGDSFINVDHITCWQKNKKKAKYKFDIEPQIQQKIKLVEQQLAAMIVEPERCKANYAKYCRQCKYRFECLPKHSGRLFHNCDGVVAFNGKKYSSINLSDNVCNLDATRLKGPKNGVVPVCRRMLLSAQKGQPAIDQIAVKKQRSLNNAIFLSIKTAPLPFHTIDGIDSWADGGCAIPFCCVAVTVRDGIISGTELFYHEEATSPSTALVEWLDANVSGLLPLVHWGETVKTVISTLKRPFIAARLHDLRNAVRNSLYYPDFDGRFTLNTVSRVTHGPEHKSPKDDRTFGQIWLQRPSDSKIKDVILRYCKFDIDQMIHIATGADGWTFMPSLEEQMAHRQKYAKFYEFTHGDVIQARNNFLSIRKAREIARKGDNLSKWFEPTIAHLYQYDQPDNQNHAYDGCDDYGIGVSVRGFCDHCKLQSSKYIGTHRTCSNDKIILSIMLNDYYIFTDLSKYPIVRIIPIESRLLLERLARGELAIKSQYPRKLFFTQILCKTYEEIEWIDVTESLKVYQSTIENE